MHLIIAGFSTVYKMNFSGYTIHDISQAKMIFVFQTAEVPATLCSFYYCLFIDFQNFAFVMMHFQRIRIIKTPLFSLKQQGFC